MRKRQELEYVPVGLERAQQPHKKRGFLIRLLRLIFPALAEKCACPCCRLSRGEEVEELTQGAIEF